MLTTKLKLSLQPLLNLPERNKNKWKTQIKVENFSNLSNSYSDCDKHNNFIMSGMSFPHNVKNHHIKQASGQSSSAPSTPTVISNRQNNSGKTKSSPNTNSSSNKVCIGKQNLLQCRNWCLTRWKINQRSYKIIQFIPGNVWEQRK